MGHSRRRHHLRTGVTDAWGGGRRDQLRMSMALQIAPVIIRESSLIRAVDLPHGTRGKRTVFLGAPRIPDIPIRVVVHPPNLCESSILKRGSSPDSWVAAAQV